MYFEQCDGFFPLEINALPLNAFLSLSVFISFNDDDWSFHHMNEFPFGKLIVINELWLILTETKLPALYAHPIDSAETPKYVLCESIAIRYAKTTKNVSTISIANRSHDGNFIV